MKPNHAELVELGIKQGKGEFPMRPETRMAMAVEVNCLRAEVERLREAAAAVVEEWEKYQPKDLSGVILNLAVEVLRLVAGIKAPPQDGDAGDRADEAYERKGDR